MVENNMENTGNQENEQAGAGQEKTFTQEDVNRIVQERLARARNEADTAATYRQERDEAVRKLKEYENNAFLREKGIRETDLDYITYKANKMVDDNTDFKTAVERFLKDNPRFTGQTYRVSTGIQSGGSGSGADSEADAIRKAMGLKGQ